MLSSESSLSYSSNIKEITDQKKEKTEKKSLKVGHLDKYNEKVWNVARITKMWHRDTKWGNAVGRFAPHVIATNIQVVKKFNICKVQKMKYACKWNHIVCTYLCLASFVHHNVLCSLIGEVVFYGMDRPQFVYPFPYWWIFGLSRDFVYYE